MCGHFDRIAFSKELYWRDITKDGYEPPTLGKHNTIRSETYTLHPPNINRRHTFITLANWETSPFSWYGLPQIPALISNHTNRNAWIENTYPFLNFNGRYLLITNLGPLNPRDQIIDSVSRCLGQFDFTLATIHRADPNTLNYIGVLFSSTGMRKHPLPNSKHRQNLSLVINLKYVRYPASFDTQRSEQLGLRQAGLAWPGPRLPTVYETVARGHV